MDTANGVQPRATSATIVSYHSPCLFIFQLFHRRFRTQRGIFVFFPTARATRGPRHYIPHRLRTSLPGTRRRKHRTMPRQPRRHTKVFPSIAQLDYDRFHFASSTYLFSIYCWYFTHFPGATAGWHGDGCRRAPSPICIWVTTLFTAIS
jgi:hypothetical protein